MGKISLAASVLFVSAACAYCFSRPRKRPKVLGGALVRNDDHLGAEITPVYAHTGLPVCSPVSAHTDAPLSADMPEDDVPESIDVPAQAAIGIPQQRVEFPDSWQVFSTVPKPARRSSAFFYSLMLHCSLVFLIGQGLDLLNDAAAEPIPHESFLVLHLTPPAQSPPVASGAASSATLYDPVLKRAKVARSAATGKAADSPPAETADGSEKRPFELPPATKPKAEYTLVQRDVRPQATPKVSIRVPEAIVWSAKELAARSPIVPGPEFGMKLPNAPLSLDLPQPAAKEAPSRIQMAAPVAPPQIPPERTATAPLRMNTSEAGNRIPESASRMTPEKVAGHLISVSEIPLPPEAMIVIPPVSQIAALKKPDLPAAAGAGSASAKDSPDSAGAAKDAAKTGRTVDVNAPVASAPVAAAPIAGTPTAGTKDTRAVNVDDHHPEVPATNSVARKSPASETATVETALVSDRNGAADRGAGSGTAEPPLGPGVIRIDRLPGVKPSSVVLGVSSKEAYPESAGVLACRIVYTVYVQVGLPKSWILQFCLPDANDGISAARGTVAALDAPWPFRIMRPTVNGLNGDYTLVHGVVNTSGRFERLALVVPDEVAKNELVPALQQWEFRPASRDGQPSAVEILLIIPHRQE